MSDLPAQFALSSFRMRSRVMIEASAGTGKTWNIERMVMSLLLPTQRGERGLNLDRILVVTYTESASLDLKERIRSILSSVLRDPQEAAAVFQTIGRPDLASDPGLYRGPVAAALRDFNAARIHTIHGFCKSVLSSYPMESAVPLALSLDNYYVGGQFRDFARARLWGLKQFSQNPELHDLIVYSMYREFGDGPEAVLDSMVRLFKDSVFDPAAYSFDWEALSHAAKAMTTADNFQPLRDHVEDRAPYMKLRDGSKDFAAALPREFFDTAFSLGLIDEPETPGAYRKAIHCKPLGGILRRLLAFSEAGKIVRDFEGYRAENPIIKVDYDDLIAKVAQAMDPPETSVLLGALRADVDAILIDEFQDTDPQQWKIFSTLAEGRPSTLVAVGDPKQAIYGFRGADLNTYLRARQEMEAQNALGALRFNRRSTPSLLFYIHALCTRIFETARTRDDSPLEYPDADYVLDRPDFWHLRDRDGKNLPLLGVLDIPESNAGSLPDAQKWTRSETVRLISVLCGGTVSISHDESETGPRPVSAKDIAVLIERNSDGEAMREELKAAGIPATIRGRGKLMQSREAEELEILFSAVQNPRDLASARALALSRLVGMDYRELTENPSGENGVGMGEGLGKVIIQIWEWHRDFDARGVFGIFNDIEKFDAAGNGSGEGGDLWIRLLSHDPQSALGSLSNFRQILQMLDDRVAESASPVTRVADLLRAMRRLAREEEDSALNKDRDSPAVSIMTMHSAKGLEFPIVFVLLGLKDRYKSASRDFAVFDELAADGSRRRAIDPLKREASLEKAKNRDFLERLRLYYVALTRAEAALFIPRTPAPESKVLGRAVLSQLYGEGYFDASVLPAKDAPENLATRLAALSERSPGVAGPGTGPGYFSDMVEPLPPSLDPEAEKEMLYSFTSISSSLKGSETRNEKWETRGDEEDGSAATNELQGGVQDTKPMETSQPGPWLDQFRGPAFGDLFHQMMETVDISRFHDEWTRNPGENFGTGRDGYIAELCRSLALRVRRMGEERRLMELARPRRNNPFLAMAYSAMSAPLFLGPGTTKSLVDLAGEASSDPSVVVLREMGFSARIGQAGLLRRSLEGISDEGRLQIRKGYLNGTLDVLIKYRDRYSIVDWKTNLLGVSEDPMKDAMTEHYYGLQALVYQTALFLLLKARARRLGSAEADSDLFASQIADAHYVFVRENGGVYRVPSSWEAVLAFASEMGLGGQS